MGDIMGNIVKVGTLDLPDLDTYARSTEAELLHLYEPDGGIFIAESPKVICRALDAGCRPISLLADPKQLEGEGREALSRCGQVPVYVAAPEVLSQITGYPLTRGMLCAMHRPPRPLAAALCAHARRIVVLENVMNPTNVGAIIRSAAALGMDAVLLAPGCSDPLYRRAIRVSMGTVFQIPWTYDPAPLSTLRGLWFKTAAMAA